jgi:hypothetical protein
VVACKGTSEAQIFEWCEQVVQGRGVTKVEQGGVKLLALMADSLALPQHFARLGQG